MKASLALSLFLFARTALCSCYVTGTAMDHFRSSPTVFAGVVDHIEEILPEKDGDEYGKRVQFRVLQWWKGEQFASSVEVWSGSVCTYPVELGKSYVVFAESNDAHPLILTSLTEPLVCALDTVKQFGKPKRSYESYELRQLIDREEPYILETPCIDGGALIPEPGIPVKNLDCWFTVDGIIDRDGTVRDFKVVGAEMPGCPQSDVLERVPKWHFARATIAGIPVLRRLTHIATNYPQKEKTE